MISMCVAMILRVTMATVMMMVMGVVIWTVRMIEMMMVVVVMMIQEPVFAEITPHQENRAQTGDEHT